MSFPALSFSEPTEPAGTAENKRNLPWVAGRTLVKCVVLEQTAWAATSKVCDSGQATYLALLSLIFLTLVIEDVMS